MTTVIGDQPPTKVYSDTSQQILVDYLKKAHKNMTKQSQTMENLIPVGETKEEADKHRAVLWQIQQQSRTARLEKNRELKKLERKVRTQAKKLPSVDCKMTRSEKRKLAEARRQAEEVVETAPQVPVIEPAPQTAEVKEEPIPETKEEPIPETKEEPVPQVKEEPDTASQVKEEPDTASQVKAEPSPVEKERIRILRKIKKFQARRSVNKNK